MNDLEGDMITWIENKERGYIMANTSKTKQQAKPAPSRPMGKPTGGKGCK